MTPADLVVTRHAARFLGRSFPVSVGRGGIVPPGAKREGDGATPAGTHTITGCLYRPDRLARPCDWALPIRPFALWCDDPAHPDYNLPVTAPFPASAERLARPDPLYDLLLLTDWNWPHAEAGRGSAIFVHQWRRPRYPTAGCVAFARADLLWIVARIDYATRLIVRG
jgi:L,D-peptidoglycan transpeptidase YkuD (ErfK/YbiS/YcfS/YnhG family)